MYGARLSQHSWKVNLIRRINEAVPKFTDIFDEDTFYLTAFLVVIGSFMKRCIAEFLSRKDVIVQAPTGSGKTLSYALPVIEILMKAKKKWKKDEIGAVVLVPSRELAGQVKAVFEAFLSVAPLRVILFVGGRKVRKDVVKFKIDGQEGRPVGDLLLSFTFFRGNIVIATPGRLQLLTDRKEMDLDLKACMRSLEVLILDEADRLLDLGFSTSLSSIMDNLPKTRRTGLFSATMPERMEELVKAGMRNPSRIVVGGEEQLLSSSGQPEKAFRDQPPSETVPFSLKMYYAVVPAQAKFLALVKFLKKHKTNKILVFFNTCRCVDYFGSYLEKTFKNSTSVLLLHGKKQHQRQKLFDHFQSLSEGMLITTDVMTRGVDIADIDWVVQFDPPRQSNWFVHRCGRTARLGKPGNALILLMPNEEGYADFLTKSLNVKLRRLNIQCPEELCLKMRDKLRARAANSREILELGTKAFVGYIQAYLLRDCHIVCDFKELDVVNLAYCFGLLRFPVMRELRARDTSGFVRSSVNTSSIPYSNPKSEEQRQSIRQERGNVSKKCRTNRQKTDLNKSKKRHGRSVIDARDLAELDNDYRLLKRLKKKKITKKEFDEQFAPD
ncbi:ATP dependent RNA helicase DDX55 [Trichuris trichiura]|uniref:ATP-dependent RNA helicase n=1 Tax=Trichuris trichiura TaxID=36087 RepID=A0A077Z164_TRITR|nr:ATP dependent RNA helicase DDX55 [Trichuris trichiura]